VLASIRFPTVIVKACPPAAPPASEAATHIALLPALSGPLVTSVSPLAIWKEPLPAPFVELHTPPESVPVVERCKLVPVYENVGEIGFSVTLKVPTALPEDSPVVVLMWDKEIV
jgi:hypothetical protein